MKNLIIILLLLFAHNLFGQTWQLIPKTQIKFSNFIKTKDTNRYICNFEYFQKGDSIISVQKDLAEDFYELFNETPNEFEKIYKASQLFTFKTEIDKSELSKSVCHILDSIIPIINFRIAVVINKKEIIEGQHVLIWKLENIILTSYLNPCFIDIKFLKKNDKKTKLKMLSIEWSGCEI